MIETVAAQRGSNDVGDSWLLIGRASSIPFCAALTLPRSLAVTLNLPRAFR